MQGWMQSTAARAARRTAAVAFAAVLAGTAQAWDGDADTGTATQEPVRIAQASEGGPSAQLYNEAREQLNRSNFRRAAEAFGELTSKYPDSPLAGDAWYWRAYALSKVGGDSNLKKALSALDMQKKRYPEAAERRDAESLATQIRGQLARRGDSKSAEKVAEEADSDDDMDTRIAALNALMNVNPDRAIPILKKILQNKDAKNADLRKRAVFILSQKQDDDTVATMVDVARNDPSPEVREQAVFWLSQVQSEESLDALLDILKTSKDVSLREKAIFALSQHGSPRAAQTLRDVAVDSQQDEALREKAIFWIGQRSSEESFGFLSGLYDKLDSADLKEKVLFSISQQSSDRNQEWLMKVVGNPRESIEMRKKALFWVGQGGHLNFTALRDLYSKFPDRELREQVIFVASQRSEPESIEFLIDRAKNEKDRQLRKKAIFWLGNSQDPRATKALEEMIAP